MAARDKGIYLGVFAGEDVGESPPVRLRYTGPKHCLLIAPPGSGKSLGIFVPNIADLPRSKIVADPKGQLATITARQAERMGRVIVSNAFGMFPELPHLKDCGWNPVLQVKRQKGDEAGAARCVADAIITKSAGGSGNGEFFEISAQNLLTLFIIWEAAKAQPDLNNIRLELASASLTQTLERMANCDVLPVRVMAGRLFARLTDKNTQNTSINDIIETVLKDLAFLDDPNLAFSLARGAPIDFGALHREITTIYLMTPVHELSGGGGKLLRMFVNLALRGLYQNPPTGGATLPPVLFMLDEFGNLGRLQEIVTALGAARDYSIQLFMALQSLAQLKAHYKNEVSLFFAGSGAVTAFAPSKDLETAEHLAKIIGNREELVMTETNNGQSLTPQAVPLIRPEDLMRLKRGYTANLIEPCPWPVLARCPVYVDTPFAEGLDPNPYYRG